MRPTTSSVPPLRSAMRASHAPRAIGNYVYETYGRFPGGSDAMHLMWVVQVHHLDIDFYDRFFRPGAYGATHAAHLGVKQHRTGTPLQRGSPP